MHFSLPVLVLAFVSMLSSDDSEAIDSSRCQIARLTILAAAWKGYHRQQDMRSALETRNEHAKYLCYSESGERLDGANLRSSRPRPQRRLPNPDRRPHRHSMAALRLQRWDEIQLVSPSMLR